jgi:hypothetical protein
MTGNLYPHVSLLICVPDGCFLEAGSGGKWVQGLPEAILPTRACGLFEADFAYPPRRPIAASTGSECHAPV